MLDKLYICPVLKVVDRKNVIKLVWMQREWLSWLPRPRNVDGLFRFEKWNKPLCSKVFTQSTLLSITWITFSSITATGYQHRFTVSEHLIALLSGSIESIWASNYLKSLLISLTVLMIVCIPIKRTFDVYNTRPTDNIVEESVHTQNVYMFKI